MCLFIFPSYVGQWPVLAERVDQVIRFIIKKGQPADPARGNGHQRLAERGIVEAVMDVETMPFKPVFAGRDRFEGDKMIMQARRAAQTAFAAGLRQRHGMVKQSFGVVERQRLQEAFGRNARPAAEQALKMIRA